METTIYIAGALSVCLGLGGLGAFMAWYARPGPR
jgi:hypothetical protein